MDKDTKILIAILEDYKDKYGFGRLLKIIVRWVSLYLDNTDGLWKNEYNI